MSINVDQGIPPLPERASREAVCRSLWKSLRPGQQRMADWQSGSLAISAVPGSGKSTGMAIAAALLLARQDWGQGDGGMGD
ncbi:MAG: hypothetical protein HC769_09090, partial [Cyanobacteria bacterium CRU_2_1]|nr:hypothetical protein [Cyanobacteria bacterium CRU_2_1]